MKNELITIEEEFLGDIWEVCFDVSIKKGFVVDVAIKEIKQHWKEWNKLEGEAYRQESERGWEEIDICLKGNFLCALEERVGKLPDIIFDKLFK